MALVDWLNSAIGFLARLAPADSVFSLEEVIRGLMAVLIVCTVCGVVGPMVVGNRMSFFSDALAHCAFAGVAIGLLVGLLSGAPKNGTYYQWGVPVIMVIFGILIGMAIAFVREQTSLANDTVIGVFFAGAIGFGAMLFKALNTRSFMTPESFLFGDPLYVTTEQLLVLIFLLILVALSLVLMHNALAFSSFNASLAHSRRIGLRLSNYVFIVLLALIVNLSLKTVGALLINGLLVVPAATAANLSRNMRQMFWLSTGISVAVGLAGASIAETVSIPDAAGGDPVRFAWAGTIVVLSVILFFASMVVGPLLKGRQAN